MFFALFSCFTNSYYLFDDTSTSPESLREQYSICCSFSTNLNSFYIYQSGTSDNSNDDSIYVDDQINGYNKIIQLLSQNNIRILSMKENSKFLILPHLIKISNYSLVKDVHKKFQFLSNLIETTYIISNFGCFDAVLKCYQSNSNFLQIKVAIFTAFIIILLFCVLYFFIYERVLLKGIKMEGFGFFNSENNTYYGDPSIDYHQNIPLNKAVAKQIHRNTAFYSFNTVSKHQLNNNIIFWQTFEQVFPDISDPSILISFKSDGIKIPSQPIGTFKNLRNYKPIEIHIPLKTASNCRIYLNEAIVTAFSVGSQFSSFTRTLFSYISKLLESSIFEKSNVQILLNYICPQLDITYSLVINKNEIIGHYHSKDLTELTKDQINEIINTFDNDDNNCGQIDKAMKGCEDVYYQKYKYFDTNLLIIFGIRNKDFADDVFDIFSIVIMILHRLSHIQSKSLELEHILKIISSDNTYGFYEYKMDEDGKLIYTRDFTNSEFSNPEKFLHHKEKIGTIQERIFEVGTSKKDQVIDENVGDQIISLVSNVNVLTDERTVFCFSENISSFLAAEANFIKEIKEKEEAIETLSIIPFSRLQKITVISPCDYKYPFNGVYHCRRNRIKEVNINIFNNYHDLANPKDDGVDIDGNVRYVLINHHNLRRNRSRSRTKIKKRSSFRYSFPHNSSNESLNSITEGDKLKEQNKQNINSGLHYIFVKAAEQTQMDFPESPFGVLRFVSSSDLIEMWMLGFNNFLMDATLFYQNTEYISPLIEFCTPNVDSIIAWNVDMETQKVTREKSFPTIWDILSVSKAMPFTQFPSFLQDESRNLFYNEIDRIYAGESPALLLDVQVLKLDGTYEWYALLSFREGCSNLKCFMINVHNYHTESVSITEQKESIHRILSVGRISLWYFTDDDQNLPYPQMFDCGINLILHINWSFVWRIVDVEDQEEFTHKIRNSFDLKHLFDIKCTIVFGDKSVHVIMRGKPQMKGNELEIAGVVIDIGAIIEDQKMQGVIEELKDQIEESQQLIDICRNSIQ
ncbi:hypothetical protein TRFO_11099 [Tritrichomonas foetus]|uniref:Transmembrane protein n=1 Tax=Tritrichomonas foetus TaxID=1144522 RepID=A0A1J4J8B7_9EUKA|nr:hypothetical protein TRFO_11099 [Tritrichomonas foetus]|eukprot:OHS94479.1 hypothetical protein TRFO_11099 [Tritrichomonas foetus]